MLNSTWQFRYHPCVEEAEDFLKEDFQTGDMTEIEVPSGK